MDLILNYSPFAHLTCPRRCGEVICMFIKYLLVGYTSRIAASRLAMLGGEAATGGAKTLRRKAPYHIFKVKEARGVRILQR